MKVLDASVGLKWVVDEADSDKARRLLSDYHAGLRDLIAPDVFGLESAHALAKLERRGLIPDSETLWFDLMVDAPVLHPSLPLMQRALVIARKARIGVYDCLYVALAEREGCELITADKRLMNALKQDFPFITNLAMMP
jgi:predicted nucleic acid-binding protein